MKVKKREEYISNFIPKKKYIYKMQFLLFLSKNYTV